MVINIILGIKKNEDGEDIVSGIYRYEVVYESFSFTNGVIVIER